MLGNNTETRIFEHCGLMTDLGLMQRGGFIMNPPRIANIFLYCFRSLCFSVKPLSYRQNLAYHAICSVHLQHYGVEWCCCGQ